jgi:hypothetical protein
VLVATGVSKSDYCVDEDKLKLFIINARAHEAKPVTPEKRTDIAIADALDQAARNIDTSSGVASAASQLRDMADEWRSK